ncbi:unnamed protein product [Rotaria socialis]|uniref:Uncharacterized protein n=1 Tax=Rotaria socialis TaxID=392032 RepID=A0A818NY72_9BILA|nr:unnamed protein product [Rotaria socialis]CAF3312331.1 unnamed protein product [Rotaria socialis]CAF3320920.1 unnamed protein product [Rotaria socialis]CAF3384194.1 unnamed protein product [Rotaria socialis]CAF3611191.1 unnamed protein product [Rotaria socialis]
MGGNSSHAKYHENICNTPPKNHVQLLFDPRSPSDAIARTPIQIDSQVLSIKSYNPVMPPVIEPDLSIDEENNENDQNEEKRNHESKVSIGVESTLDPTRILTHSDTNHNGQTPL